LLIEVDDLKLITMTTYPLLRTIIAAFLQFRLTAFFCLSLLLLTTLCLAQTDSLPLAPPAKTYKNIVRYNLSGPLLFGFDRYVILGYERVIKKNQSFSINIGQASLPKLISIITDSFDVQKDQKTTGFNFSVDYRFYLAKENRHSAPHGLYIGPYYSFNKFNRETRWEFKNNSDYIDTRTNFTIHTAGFELGYQFILWKRLALDLVMFGPGLGIYNYKAKFEDNISSETKEQLLDGLEQLLTQKFPGMNYVFSDQEINANGVMKTNAIAYRYMIHIGFNF